MLTIAGGIVLAVLLLAILPWLAVAGLAALALWALYMWVHAWVAAWTWSGVLLWTGIIAVCGGIFALDVWLQRGRPSDAPPLGLREIWRMVLTHNRRHPEG